MMDTETALRGEIAVPEMSNAGGGTQSGHPTHGAYTCLWCGCPILPRTDGGRPRRFCHAQHRTAYYSAARRFVDQLVQQGRLPVAVLHAPPATCTLLPGAVSGGGATTLPGKAPRAWVSPIRVLWAEPGNPRIATTNNGA
jgi:hypothetical protein